MLRLDLSMSIKGLPFGGVLVVDSWKAASRSHEDEGSIPSSSIIQRHPGYAWLGWDCG
jgi:hypothetical protein